MLLVQAQAYRQQYGFDAITLFPVNLYGPRDNFDPASSHVIPALVRKMSDAVTTGAREVSLWGDGTPTREFLYVDDAAEAILLASERYDGADPVNVGSGVEIRIAELARHVADAVGFTGAIRWDSTKPNGQPRRSLSTARAEQAFGFRAHTPFASGLRETVAWFRHGGDQR
jgi:GDP-L-fucose synthase